MTAKPRRMRLAIEIVTSDSRNKRCWQEGAQKALGIEKREHFVPPVRAGLNLAVADDRIVAETGRIVARQGEDVLDGIGTLDAQRHQRMLAPEQDKVLVLVLRGGRLK